MRFFFKVGKIFQNMLHMWTAVSHICESRQSLRHNIQSCFDLKWDTAMYEWRQLHLSWDPPIKQLIATICSQVTHIMWLLGHRDKALFFVRLPFPHNSKGKQIQRKGIEVIPFPGTEKDARKLMLRKHFWSCFYQMTKTQSNTNVNSKTWGRGHHSGNCFRDRQMLARGFLSVALGATEGLCVLRDQLHQNKRFVGAIKHMS